MLYVFWPNKFISGNLARESNSNTESLPYTDVNSSVIYNSKKIETLRISINGKFMLSILHITKGNCMPLKIIHKGF